MIGDHMFKVGDRVIHTSTWDKGTILATKYLDMCPIECVEWDDKFPTYADTCNLMLYVEYSFYQQLGDL